jgi:ATP-dependent Clp protease ATP-binding subunit ClpA
VRLLSRRRPRARTIRPAERYLVAGADEARRHGCSIVGTEHVLLALLRGGGTGAALARLGVEPGEVEAALGCWLTPDPAPPKIDPEALAALGIDFDSVRARLERTFGPGALERTSASCLNVSPRLKLALAYAVDEAGGAPLGEEHVLLGMLLVPDSVVARVLGSFGVLPEDITRG